jgi:hypothetical protein
MSDRTVFVLGAGFSAPAKMPVQQDIMREVLARRSQIFVEEARETITTLFKAVDTDEMSQVPLEDVFTMLDRARTRGETIQGFTHEEIWQSYRALIKTIVHEFRRKLLGFNAVGSYQSFFEQLILKREANGTLDDQKADPFSVITLNWDTIPDHLLNTLSVSKKVVLDYGCYDYDLNDTTGHIPSIRRKGTGLFNVKLLKLHGSLNWLACSCCSRLFSLNESGGNPPVAPLNAKCRFCQGAELENVIVTPTLLKDLAQNQIKNIWHNAFLDLQACERIVFVGYSLPMADFEFRYTLLKAIIGNSLVKVRVVLFPPDPCAGEKLWARNEIKDRYSRFFGLARDLDFKYMDSSDFMLDPDLIWNW